MTLTKEQLDLITQIADLGCDNIEDKDGNIIEIKCDDCPLLSCCGSLYRNSHKVATGFLAGLESSKPVDIDHEILDLQLLENDVRNARNKAYQYMLDYPNTDALIEAIHDGLHNQLTYLDDQIKFMKQRKSPKNTTTE
jgi:hypothetical protein